MKTAKTATMYTNGRNVMRGSIFYQTSLLAKAIFEEGATKKAKTDQYKSKTRARKGFYSKI